MMTWQKTHAAAVMIVAVAALTGCGNRAANESGSTNSTAGAESATNYLLNNNPVAGITNTPPLTNNLSTHLPAQTNR